MWKAGWARCGALLALLAWAAACGDEGSEGGQGAGNNAAQNSGQNNANNQSNANNPNSVNNVNNTNNVNNANNVNNTNNANNPNNVNNAQEGCQTNADCDEEGGFRCISDGRCVDKRDRACASNVDCREHEACQDVGGAQACVRQETPIEVCPGGPDCAPTEGAVLEVGAAKRSIVPPGFEQALPEYLEDGLLFIGDPQSFGDEPTFVDCGLDQLCEGDPGYPGPDMGEEDGVMQGMWLAGFDHSRPAQRYCADGPEGACPADMPWAGEAAHDDIWARMVVFREGETAVGLVVVDTVGYFYDEVFSVEQKLSPETDLDLIILASTHNHEAPDTMGQWGPGALGDDLPVQPGADKWWREYINTKIAEGLDEAYAELRPATLRAAKVDTGALNMGVQDSRSPWVFDDDLALLQARDAESGEVIATLMNWGNHAEALSDENKWITADYTGYACRFVEEGLPEVRDPDTNALRTPGIPGAGGVAVYVMGAVGGLITPLRGATALNRLGEHWRSGNYEMAEAMGERLAERSLVALAVAPETQGGVSFASREFVMPVDNAQFHTAIYGLDLFDRGLYNATSALPFEGLNRPGALTRASIVRVGGATFFTLPGEVFPETLVGGFDASQDYEFTPFMGDPYRVECGEDLLPLACTSHEDCPQDWSCEGAACRPVPRACGGDGDCSEGATCVGGACQRACESGGTHCGAGFYCQQDGVCGFNPGAADSDGYSFRCLVRPNHENPPALGEAPQGPYLKEKMPGEVIFAVGLGHDALGYIVPSYDFKLSEDGAYFFEAEGDHYEETNSVGPAHVVRITEALDELLGALR